MKNFPLFALILALTACEMTQKSQPVSLPPQDADDLQIAAQDVTDAQDVQATAEVVGTDVAEIQDIQTLTDTQTTPQCVKPAEWPALEATPKATGLVIHEWGTFTSMQNRDGATLEGMHHEDEPLPEFVHGRLVDGVNTKGVERLPQEVTQKMETPVVYFYTPTPMDVQVKVDFPQGIISQWFPDALTFAPKLTEAPNLKDGSMTWKIQANPLLGMETAPKVTADSIWNPSRQTSAATVKMGSEVEKLIFYRGLGRFELPLQIKSYAGTITAANSGKQAIPAAFLLRVDADGKGFITELGAIEAGAMTTQEIPKQTCADYVQDARLHLRGALMAAGLYDDEARAMVDTWKHSYLQTPGLRVLYVLPQPWTEDLLPMTVTPTPQKKVRVLVGRIEVLTAEAEAAMLAQLKSWYVVWNAGTDWQGAAPLVAKDRFLESRLRAVVDSIADEALKNFAQGLISELDQTVVSPGPVNAP